MQFSQFASLLVILVFSLAGCQPTENGTALLDEYYETLVFEVLGQGYRAGVSDTTEVIFRDAAEWEAFSTSLQPIGDLADADFEQTMVVAVVVPARSGGYRVAFDTVDLVDDEIVASYTLTAPGLDCMTMAAMTQPFQAIAVRKADGPIRFVRTEVRESCSM